MMAWAVCSTAAAGACAARSMVSEASYTDCDRRRPTDGARAKEPRNAGSSGRPAIAVVASYTERGSLHLGSYTDCIILVGRTPRRRRSNGGEGGGGPDHP